MNKNNYTKICYWHDQYLPFKHNTCIVKMSMLVWALVNQKYSNQFNYLNHTRSLSELGHRVRNTDCLCVVNVLSLLQAKPLQYWWISFLPIHDFGDVMWTRRVIQVLPLLKLLLEIANRQMLDWPWLLGIFPINCFNCWVRANIIGMGSLYD